MSPDIFINDFEITDNTEELHAILGRSIIIATRFDNLCGHTSKYLNIKMPFASLLPNDEFDDYVNKLFSKFSSLNNNINSLTIGQPEKDILHKARIARNEIAHSLTIGMTGCLDAKIDEQSYKAQISSLVSEVAAGDFLISTILSIFNKYSLPNHSESDYIDRIINWVKD